MKHIFAALISIVLGFSQVVWNTEVVDSSPGQIGLSISIALENDNLPHIAYTLNSDQNFVMYSFKNDTIWEKEVIDSSLFGGPYWGLPFYGLSLALNQDSDPRLSYYHYDSLNDRTEICFASRDSLGWTHEVLDTIAGTIYSLQMYYTSLNLDTAGLPGIAYSYWNFIDSTQVIKYLKYTGMGWDSLIVGDSCPQWNFGPSLSIDDQNQPHIAYYQNDTLKYVYYNNQTGSWNTLYCKYIVSPGERASLSLVLDSQDYARIAHSDNWWLTYSWWDGSTWHNDNIISIGFWGVAINLALDTLENPHITYTVEFNFWLEYCCKNTSWHLYGPIDPDSSHTMLDHSLAVDGLSNPHVCYESGYLLYAKGTFTGVEETRTKIPRARFALQVYPNPVQGVLNIKYAVYTQTETELSLYDVTGSRINVLKHKNVVPGYYQENIDVSKLSNGIYFIMLRQDNDKVTRKFLVVK
ncbi:MAG: T9SS type A sorting domain-containing protein [bacterium]